MAQQGYLVWCRQLDQPEQAVRTALAAAGNGALKRYEPGKYEIHTVINEYLLASARNAPGKR